MASQRSFGQNGMASTSRIRLLATLTIVLSLGAAVATVWGLAQRQLGVAFAGAVAGAVLMLVLLILSILSLRSSG